MRCRMIFFNAFSGAEDRGAGGIAALQFAIFQVANVQHIPAKLPRRFHNKCGARIGFYFTLITDLAAHFRIKISLFKNERDGAGFIGRDGFLQAMSIPNGGCARAQGLMFIFGMIVGWFNAKQWQFGQDFRWHI